MAYIYGNVQKSERPESFPEFETASEDIAVHQDSSGEKYTIKRITYINRSPTRSGYRRLNIVSDKNGYIFGDTEDFYDVESVFYLGTANEDICIYAVIYCNGREFLALKNDHRVCFLEYTLEKILILSIQKNFIMKNFMMMFFLYLTQNAEGISDRYLSEQSDNEKINKFIETVSLLYGKGQGVAD